MSTNVEKDARTLQLAHNRDKREQHKWGICDHPCCRHCAYPGEEITPSTECPEGRY